MKLPHRWLFLFPLLLLATAPVARAADIHLSAAASLKEALNDISDSYARKHPGTSFVRSYGGSGTLALQLQHGAPVDIFFAASSDWVEYLLQRKYFVPGMVQDVAYNTLVFVGRPGAKVSSLQDLVKLRKIAIGSPRSVPAGEYAMEALKNSNLDRQLERKLVLAKDVRQCLFYAERGEVDGALVYRTDAVLSHNVKVLFEVPQSLYHRVTYPMALTVAGATKTNVRDFFSYLQGPEAKTVLAKRGFVTR